MVVATYNKDQVMHLLASIPDPEIPVVNIVEMGMVRDVVIDSLGCEVILTPTYSGCPAMGIIEQDIKKMLADNHISPVTVKLVYSPAWTTDWMTDNVKEKLRKYGIAPPVHSSCNISFFALNEVSCPRCGAQDTDLISRFGATACKALYKCNKCKEPFEYFKCH